MYVPFHSAVWLTEGGVSSSTRTSEDMCTCRDDGAVCLCKHICLHGKLYWTGIENMIVILFAFYLYCFQI